MTKRSIGVLGASSFVGKALLPLLMKEDAEVTGFSREPGDNFTDSGLEDNMSWCQLKQPFDDTSQFKSHNSHQQEIKEWICLTPIWVLPDYFDCMKSLGAKRVVVLSSTSRFTKADSEDSNETAIVKKLVEGEEKLIQWAKEREVEWVILRPTLIYGGGKDKNISEIARFIRRFGFFPIFGKGQGYRQPIHIEDVAKACQAALTSPHARNRAYNLSGGEMLPYKEMVKRIFTALYKKARFIQLPRWGFQLALLGLRFLPRFQHWSVAMADRMDRDMVFDHKDAEADLGFSPRPFLLEKRDLPQ